MAATAAADQTHARILQWRQDEKVWGDIQLPAWDAKLAYRLFRFRRHKLRTGREMGARATDRYTRLLMQLIAIRFRQWGLLNSLHRAKLEVDETAQEGLKHWIEMTRRLEMRSPGYRPWLGCIGRALKNTVVSQIDKAKGQGEEVVAEADWARELEDGEVHTLDHTAGSHVCPEVYRSALRKSFGLKIETILDKIPGDINALYALVAYQRRLLLAGHTPVHYSGLPRHLLKRISEVQHLAVQNRIYRHVREFVRGVATAFETD